MRYLLFAVILYTEISAAPTQDFLEKIPWEKIQSDLQERYSSNNWQEIDDLFSSIVATETDDCIGYHASTLSYALYQEIIRTVFEKICLVPIRSNFHFLRIPGDSAFSAKNKRTECTNDRDPTFRKQLVSLNFSLFGNFQEKEESTAHYFIQNRSNEANLLPVYVKTLGDWFEELGGKREELETLFSSFHNNFSEQTGVILKFSCKSCSFLDEHFYVSREKGAHIPFLSPSKVLKKQLFFNGEQLRLIISNRSTLNPKSPLNIVRYDTFGEKNWIEMRTRLQEAIGHCTFDPTKITAYKEKIQTEWTK